MNKLFAKIKKENLTQDEKSEIFVRLQDFVSKNQVEKIKSPFYSSWLVSKQKTFITLMTLVLIFVITYSTAFASNYSLPGDLLYPIKILGENIQTLTAIGKKAQAEVLAKQAITRLKEVEQLTNAGRLNERTKQQVITKFMAQSQAAIANINNLKNNGNVVVASTINSSFKTSLTEHKNTITSLSSKNNTKNETKKELGDVISNVQTRIIETSDINSQINESPEKIDMTNSSSTKKDKNSNINDKYKESSDEQKKIKNDNEMNAEQGNSKIDKIDLNLENNSQNSTTSLNLEKSTNTGDQENKNMQQTSSVILSGETNQSNPVEATTTSISDHKDTTDTENKTNNENN